MDQIAVTHLEAEWERHAATAQARDMLDRLHRWALDWAGRLDQTSLAEHLDEASKLLRTAQAELGTSMDNHLPVDPPLLEAATSDGEPDG